MQDNYKIIERKMRDREPFKGNTLTAYWDGEVYKVVSYSTLIATAVQIGYWTTFNDRKYSSTTSKHQSIVKRTGVIL